jgi:peptide/nickel transport system permease protein
MLILCFFLSIIVFIIIQLPPGDYVTTLSARYALSGGGMNQEELDALRKQFGLDVPMYQQYFRWLYNMIRGNLGVSYEWRKPVADLLMERLPITVILTLSSLLFTYVLAIPIGIYSATHQYSLFDYLFTGLGFIGLATPSFLLALILMFLFIKYLGISVIGLFSPGMMEAPWSFAKFFDLLKHLPVPIIIIGLAGTAGLIRVVRGTLLDELRKQYVTTARAKGVAERTLLFKYPVRVAINPIVSTIGWSLTYIVSGETITAIVLTLPTTGPLLYGALISEDMFLAGSTVMVLSLLTLIGTLVSDILLVAVDPRIRYERRIKR